jgi:hypothetical protein
VNHPLFLLPPLNAYFSNDIVHSTRLPDEHTVLSVIQTQKSLLSL